MIRAWASDNRAISLYLTIKCKGKKRFYVCAKDGGKGRVNSKYASREIDVDGERSIFLSFPLTPKAMLVGVTNVENKADEDFEVKFEEKPLKHWQIWMDADTTEFLKLCFYFCQVCGFEKASKSGRIFQSQDEKYHIKFYPQIVDYMSGNVLNTPARIGHNTGNIDVSKAKFDKYTFAQRVIIMLHEFSHKYRNPKMGLEIENETGADINALYIYLGLGFSKVDAIYVFATVFLSAQTDSNIQRMRAIMDYIQRFDNNEYAQPA